MTIQEMQDAILKAGWQFQEHVYNDGILADCWVELSLSKNPLIFLGHRDPSEAGRKDRESIVGWGRFSREWAWEQAYRYIILGERRS